MHRLRTMYGVAALLRIRPRITDRAVVCVSPSSIEQP
jgi:hypothetical protein